MFYISIFLIIIGTISYALIEKTVPKKENPHLYLTLTYLTAFVCLFICLFVSKYDMRNFFSDISWQAMAVGIAAMFSDYGLLLSYRKGWKISTLNITYTIFVFIALTIIGVLLFNDDITLIEYIGIILCILSIILMNHKVPKCYRKKG